MRISAAVLGAPDPRALGAFYARLLGWVVVRDDSGWVMLRPPQGGTGLSFQQEPDYVRPVWPPAAGAQQMMVHLDVAVADLDQGVAWAIAAGAALADYQPQADVRVLLDPAGHPFCLFSAQP
ncbi:MAG: VOC family protein [Chloroflexi bacterium]|nr:VOC family protein [Chloroflexota bacterium]